MTIITYFIQLFSTYWYIVIPELLFILMAGVRFAGPWAAALIACYIVGLVVDPAAAMAFVGALILIGAGNFVVKEAAGDIISRGKEPPEENGANGIPRLSGSSKDVQDALDSMKSSKSGSSKDVRDVRDSMKSSK